MTQVVENLDSKRLVVVPLIRKFSNININLVLLVSIAALLVVFKGELSLLFLPDPAVQTTYKYTFHPAAMKNIENILSLKGFVVESNGLQLPPGQ